MTVFSSSQAVRLRGGTDTFARFRRKGCLSHALPPLQTSGDSVPHPGKNRKKQGRSALHQFEVLELKSGAGRSVPVYRIKHLEGRLWEMRMKGRDGISRAIYVTAQQSRIVVVRLFVKKTQKTPRHEIVLALQRAKEVEER